MTDKKNNSIAQLDGTLVPVGLDNYSDIELSNEARNALANTVLSARTGLVSVTPLVCKGSDCPFIKRCPIYGKDGLNSLAINRQCLVEVGLMQSQFSAYVDELNKTGKVAESITYRSLISKLVDLDIFEWRIKLALAGVSGNSDGSLFIDQPIGIDKHTEEPVYQLQEHPAWRMLKDVDSQRLKLLDVLGLTPKSKARIDTMLNRKEDENFLTKSIELLEKITDYHDR